MPTLHKQFDWRDGGTWRALCALGVLAGAFIAVAALASEFLARDVFGLPIGHDTRFGPDMAAAAMMLLLVLKMVWRRFRIRGLAAIREQFRDAGPVGGESPARTRVTVGIFAAWLALTLASYFLVFYTVMIAFDLDGPGRFTTLVAVLAPLMLGQLVLTAELERLGARRLPPRATGGSGPHFT